METDYGKNDPKGWGGDPTRGAALGRPSVHLVDVDSYTGKISVTRVKLNSGGYDKNGTYFGRSSSFSYMSGLYWCVNEDNTIDFMHRGTRKEVVNYVLSLYTNAKVKK